MPCPAQALVVIHQITFLLFLLLLLCFIQITFVAFITSTSFIQLGTSNLNEGNMFLSAIFFSLMVMFMGGFNNAPVFCKRLPVFYKQRDHHFFTPVSYALAGSLLRIPEHLLNATVWSVMVSARSSLATVVVAVKRHLGRTYSHWLCVAVLCHRSLAPPHATHRRRCIGGGS